MFLIRLELKKHLWLLKTLVPVKRKHLWIIESHGQCFLWEPNLIQLWLKGSRMCRTVVSSAQHKINRVMPFYIFLSVLFLQNKWLTLVWDPPCSQLKSCAPSWGSWAPEFFWLCPVPYHQETFQRILTEKKKKKNKNKNRNKSKSKPLLSHSGSRSRHTCSWSLCGGWEERGQASDPEPPAISVQST